MEINSQVVKLSTVLNSFLDTDSDDDKRKRIAEVFKNATEADKDKMFFFLLLNTKLPVSEKLAQDTCVGLFVNICPNITAEFLTDLILNLNLVSSFSKVISNCPSEVTDKILSCVFDVLVRHKDIGIEHVKVIDEVLLGITERLKKVHMKMHNDNVDKLYTHLYSLSFLDFEINEEIVCSHLRTLLRVCLSVIMMQHDDSVTVSDDPVFKMNYELFPVMNSLMTWSDFTNDYIIPALNSDYAWVLIKFDYDKNLLQVLSEIVYIVRKDVVAPDAIRSLDWLITNMNITSVNPDKLDFKMMLSKLTVDNSKYEIESPDIEVILSAMASGKATKDWFKLLVQHQRTFEMESAIACVNSHLDTADVDDLRTIVETVKSELNNQSQFSGPLQNLYFNALWRMPECDQLIHFNAYFESVDRFLWDTSSIDEKLTETFNKFLETSGSYEGIRSCLIELCMKSPTKTVAKICSHALCSTSQLKSSVDLLLTLKRACLDKCEIGGNVINSVLYHFIDKSELSAKESKYLVDLVTALMTHKVLGDEFITQCVLEALRKGLDDNNYGKVDVSLEILNSSIKLKILPNLSVLMVFMLQVLNRTSWDCCSFTVQLANTRQNIISIIKLLIRNYIPSGDKELMWLRKEVMNAWEINRVCFCDLWFLHESVFVSSNDLYLQLFMLLHTNVKVTEIIDTITSEFHGKELHDLRVCFNAALMKLMPILTAKQWSQLFIHVKSIVTAWSEPGSKINAALEVVSLFTTSVYYIVQDMNLHKDIGPCLEFCMRNLGCVVKQNIPTVVTPESEGCLRILKELMFLLHGVEDPASRKSFSMILSPVIMELARLSESDDGCRPLTTWFKTFYGG